MRLRLLALPPLQRVLRSIAPLVASRLNRPMLCSLEAVTSDETTGPSVEEVTAQLQQGAERFNEELAEQRRAIHDLETQVTGMTAATRELVEATRALETAESERAHVEQRSSSLEYRVVAYGGGKKAAKLEATLNRLGEDGWHLARVDARAGLLILMRSPPA
jgi:hypothetical protein